MRAVAVPGRWVWGLSGLVTAAAIAIPGTRLITMAGMPVPAPPPEVATRTVTVPQPVTSLTVDTNGGQVQVTAGPVSRVHVSETIMYDQKAGGPPAVAESVSGGRLSLGNGQYRGGPAAITFAEAPDTVLVSTDGGPAVLTVPGGPYAVTADSGGGPQWVGVATNPGRPRLPHGRKRRRPPADPAVTAGPRGGPPI